MPAARRITRRLVVVVVLLCDTAGEAQCVNAQTPPLVVVHAAADERLRLNCTSVPLPLGRCGPYTTKLPLVLVMRRCFSGELTPIAGCRS